MIRIKVYLSDEGFGHIMRQRAIIMELRERCPDALITVQTLQHVNYAREVLPEGIRFIPKFNNIVTVKSDGGLDIERTRKTMSMYPERAHPFVQDESTEAGYDFIISDLVPEAFVVARNLDVPNCGVCHFTWDWFFGKVFSPDDRFVRAIERYMDALDVLYLPPLTPVEIVDKYARKAIQVPFIASRDEKEHSVGSGKKKIMILDSGTAVLSQVIRNVLPSLRGIDDMQFYVAPQFALGAPNITAIPSASQIHSLLPDMDLVVSRAGFNTITECIVHRVPMVLVDEAGNPEIHENLRAVDRLGLCIALPLKDYQRRLAEVLRHVFRNDYDRILTNMRQFKANGAEIIASDVLLRSGVEVQPPAGPAAMTGSAEVPER